MLGKRLLHRHASCYFLLDSVIRRSQLREQLNDLVKLVLWYHHDALDRIGKYDVTLPSLSDRVESGYTRTRAYRLHLDALHLDRHVNRPRLCLHARSDRRCCQAPDLHSSSSAGQSQCGATQPPALEYRKLQPPQLDQVSHSTACYDTERATRLHAQRHDAAENSATLLWRLAHDHNRVRLREVDIVRIGWNVGGAVAAEVLYVTIGRGVFRNEEDCGGRPDCARL